MPRGGKREGAGRPKGTTKPGRKTYVTFSVSCLADEQEVVRRNAERAGKSVSRYLVDFALADSGR